jgi:hypothetical protein
VLTPKSPPIVAWLLVAAVKRNVPQLTAPSIALAPLGPHWHVPGQLTEPSIQALAALLLIWNRPLTAAGAQMS